MTTGNEPSFDPSITRPNSRVAELLDGWQATRQQTALATRIVASEDDYLAAEPQAIGRAVGDNLRELFVSCDPAPALLQQFDHSQPEYIALHDLGTASSRKLLAGVAEASGLTLKRLVIRRQGYGTALATLEYLEIPGAEGGVLHIYSTEADADTAARQGLARVLLAYSRLGVVMVGELPAHALAAEVKALREDIITGPWPNRDLLLLPLASSAALASQGSDLGRGTGLTVRTTPAAPRPADAWNFISGAWSRLRTQLAASGKLVPPLAMTVAQPAAANRPAPVTRPAAFGPSVVTPALQPLSLRPMPAVPQTPTIGPALDAHSSELLARYVQQMSKLNGVLDCCVFEAASGRHVAHAGSAADPDSMAQAGSALLASIGRAARRFGQASSLPEAAITLDARHLILRPLPRHPALVLHAVLDREHANLTLARLQIQRMDEMFEEPAP